MSADRLGESLDLCHRKRPLSSLQDKSDGMLDVSYLASTLESGTIEEEECMPDSHGGEDSSCCGKRRRLLTAECEVAVVHSAPKTALEVEEVTDSAHEQLSVTLANVSRCSGMDTSHNEDKKGQFYTGSFIPRLCLIMPRGKPTMLPTRLAKLSATVYLFLQRFL